MNIIDHLKNVIRASGRKSYTFVMGKLNVAKMANFAEVDCYVLVACPENSLIDSKVSSYRNGKAYSSSVLTTVCFFVCMYARVGVLPPDSNPV